MGPSNPSYVASEDIGVSLFVNIVAGSDHKIEACDAGDIAIGVTAEYPQDAVLPGAAIGPAVLSGHSCRVYGLGESCEVLAGGTVNAGDYLKPDANAKAVVCISGDEYSAIARAGGSVAGGRVKITIEHGTAP